MLCPKCMGKSSVVDSRLVTRDGTKTIRRKRICTWCKHSYRTLEVLESSPPKQATPSPKKQKQKHSKRGKRILNPLPKRKAVDEPDPDLKAGWYEDLTDEEFEKALFDGNIRFDEDEL